MLLQTLLEEFYDQLNAFNPGISRHTTFKEIPNKIMVAIGMRRTGKTHFLFQTIQKILKEVSLDQVLYLNFEDDRLFPMTSDQMAKLIDDFYTLYPENHSRTCYLFLDEVQNIENWDRVVRRMFDTKNVKIYLTGSSAKLLSTEIATSLRGRAITTEIWPYSFQEFLEFQEFPILDTKMLSKKNLDLLKKQLNLYLDQGGFPEIMGHSLSDRLYVLQDYVSVVIFRDIVERHKITNVSLIRYMIKTLVKNAGCGFSVHKFFNDLKSQGFSVSKTTLYDYLRYIEDTYLAFTVPLYSESLRQSSTNLKKIYAIDTGLVKAYANSLSQNVGHCFENLVYLDLRRTGYEVYYYLTKSRREVDFLARSPENQWRLYQVTWDMTDPQTIEREKLALEEAEQELGIKGEIITPESYLSSQGMMPITDAK
jgi:predicted AAA+ superfamily ATPase